MILWCLQINQKKSNEIFVRILALASKMKSKQKNKGTLLGFLVDLKTPKEHFEINWPLGTSLEFYSSKSRKVK